MANKRITEVDSIDSLNSNDSLFINHNNTIRQVSKSNVVFDVANGGTGATNAADARANLGVAAANHEHQISELVGGTLSVEYGGTGATNGADALANLFSAGATVLSSEQYGAELPAAGIKGRIFFKKIATT